MSILTRYRRFRIRFDESTEEWVVDNDGGEDIRDYCLKDVKTEIDKLLKHKVLGKKALRIEYDKKFEIVDVTNIAKDSKNEFWISCNYGIGRVKVGTDNLFRDSPYNRKILKNMFDVKEQIKALENKRDKLRKGLVKFGGGK